ncbi:MAG: DUF3613 domain-containing protein [Algiphilus sp.]|uniref:DUF3613 domain-containing protein n=1 Tax=Algiphilus sp. TaxID=1872431 RepID=UPI0032EEA7B2
MIAVSAPLFAQPVAQEEEESPRFGQQTRDWVQLQVSGDAADGPPTGFSAEIADRVWKRYSKSFDNEIPESFERESFAEGQR